MLVLWTALASADDGGEGVGKGVALSVGTGPRPISTATLGLTGLGARVLFPAGGVVPWVGLQATRAGVATFDDGERDDRYETAATALHGSAGVRIDLTERRAKNVAPYVTVGALAGRAAIVSTDVADDYRYVVGTTTVAGLAGFGLDGFVTKHLSIGGELGAFAGQSFGRDKEIDEGDVEKGDEKVTTTILSSFTGLMITVWR